GIDPAGHGGQYTQSHSAFSVCASPGPKPRPGHTRPVGECGRRFCENCSMALFRRRRPTDSTSATTEFWDYWPKVRQTLSEAAELASPVRGGRAGQCSCPPDPPRPGLGGRSCPQGPTGCVGRPRPVPGRAPRQALDPTGRVGNPLTDGCGSVLHVDLASRPLRRGPYPG